MNMNQQVGKGTAKALLPPQEVKEQFEAVKKLISCTFWQNSSLKIFFHAFFLIEQSPHEYSCELLDHMKSVGGLRQELAKELRDEYPCLDVSQH